MAISLPDARRLSDEVLEAIRLRVLCGCQLGFTETDVADLLGMSRETVSRWWTAYAISGLDAIPSDRTWRPVGSGRTLSDEQARHIQQQIDDHSPEGGQRPPCGFRDRIKSAQSTHARIAASLWDTFDQITARPSKLYLS